MFNTTFEKYHGPHTDSNDTTEIFLFTVSLNVWKAVGGKTFTLSSFVETLSLNVFALRTLSYGKAYREPVNYFLSPPTTGPPKYSVQAVSNIGMVMLVFEKHYQIKLWTTVDRTTWNWIGDKSFKRELLSKNCASMFCLLVSGIFCRKIPLQFPVSDSLPYDSAYSGRDKTFGDSL